MIYDIVAKLDEIKEKKSIFSKRVVKGLFGVPIMDNGQKIDDVNIIMILFAFIQLATKFGQCEFKQSIFGTQCGKSRGKKFDMNYHLTHEELKLTVGDCKNRFIVLFKAFRTCIGHIIFRSTGSYQPTEEDCYNPKYRIGNGDNAVKKTANTGDSEFRDFIQELATLYYELEKLPKNLSCIGSIFAAAKKEVAEFREKKQAIREMREMKQMQMKLRDMKNFERDSASRQTERTRKYKEKMNAKPVAKPEPVVDRAPISAPIKWGGYNPVTNAVIDVNAPSFVPQVSAPVFVPSVPASPEGFVTVQRHRSKPAHTPVQVEDSQERLTGKARKAQRAKDWKKMQKLNQ
jgi:Skp family chaperone for outer membrane proteins